MSMTENRNRGVLEEVPGHPVRGKQEEKSEGESARCQDQNKFNEILHGEAVKPQMLDSSSDGDEPRNLLHSSTEAPRTG